MSEEHPPLLRYQDKEQLTGTCIWTMADIVNFRCCILMLTVYHGQHANFNLKFARWPSKYFIKECVLAYFFSLLPFPLSSHFPTPPLPSLLQFPPSSPSLTPPLHSLLPPLLIPLSHTTTSHLHFISLSHTTTSHLHLIPLSHTTTSHITSYLLSHTPLSLPYLTISFQP